MHYEFCHTRDAILIVRLLHLPHIAQEKKSYNEEKEVEQAQKKAASFSKARSGANVSRLPQNVSLCHNNVINDRVIGVWQVGTCISHMRHGMRTTALASPQAHDQITWYTDAYIWSSEARTHARTLPALLRAINTVAFNNNKLRVLNKLPQSSR